MVYKSALLRTSLPITAIPLRNVCLFLYNSTLWAIYNVLDSVSHRLNNRNNRFYLRITDTSKYPTKQCRLVGLAIRGMTNVASPRALLTRSRKAQAFKIACNETQKNVLRSKARRICGAFRVVHLSWNDEVFGCGAPYIVNLYI